MKNENGAIKPKEKINSKLAEKLSTESFILREKLAQAKSTNGYFCTSISALKQARKVENIIKQIFKNL